MEDKYLYIGIVEKRRVEYVEEKSSVSLDKQYLFAFSAQEIVDACHKYIQAELQNEYNEVKTKKTCTSVMADDSLTIIHKPLISSKYAPVTSQIVYNYTYFSKNITPSQYDEFFGSEEYKKFLDKLMDLNPKDEAVKTKCDVNNVVYMIRKPGQTDEDLQQAALLLRGGVYKLRENAEKHRDDEIKNLKYWLDIHGSNPCYSVSRKYDILERKDKLVQLVNSEIVAVKVTAEVIKEA